MLRPRAYRECCITGLLRKVTSDGELALFILKDTRHTVTCAERGEKSNCLCDLVSVCVYVCVRTYVCVCVGHVHSHVCVCEPVSLVCIHTFMGVYVDCFS